MQNIGSGLNKSVGLFDENVSSVLNMLDERLKAIRAAAEMKDGDQSGLVQQVASLQHIMTDIAVQLEKISGNMDKEVAKV